MNEVASKRSNQLTVVLDRVRNAHNISAVVRSADAFGLNRIHLVGEKVDLSSGVTMGTDRWVEVCVHETPSAAITALKGEGFQFVILEAAHLSERGESVPVYELPFEQKLALVFGNEIKGIRDEFQEVADISAHIPMLGFVDSLNISVACAISLFSSTISGVRSERQLATLSPDEQEEVKTKWLSRDLKYAEQVLAKSPPRQDS